MDAHRTPAPEDPAPEPGPDSTERRARRRGGADVVGDALYGILRFVGRHVQGFFGVILTVLGIGFVFALAAGFVFAGFGHVVAEGATQSLDEAVLQWFQAHRTPLVDEVMLEITSLGGFAPIILMVAVAAVFLWLTGHKWSVFVLFASVTGGALLNALLKDFYDRPRPIVVEHVDQVRSLSFPSGHAMAAAVAYGSIAYLVGRLEPTHRLRSVTLALAVVVIGLIGISRMYLGVHYPSDVLAGFLAGLAWLAFVVAALKAIQYFAARRPEVEQQEQDLHAEREREMGLRD